MATPLVQPFEDLLNRGLAASARARELCGRLAGRSLRVEVTGLPIAVQISAEDDRLRVSDRPAGDADAVLSGMPFSLARLAVTRDAGMLRGGSVRMAGDPLVARDFQALLGLVRPDWEEELSRLVGDVAAHQLGNLVRGLSRWSARSADTLAKDLGEYLQEEQRSLPTRYEVEEFLDGVDRLNDDLERLEARIARLERRRRGPGS